MLPATPCLQQPQWESGAVQWPAAAQPRWAGDNVQAHPSGPLSPSPALGQEAAASSAPRSLTMWDAGPQG